jgi:hypothetical protein
MHGRTFFERPASAAKPGAQRAAADCDGLLGKQLRSHFVQRDVPTLLDLSDDEGLMRIKARVASPALRSRGQLSRPGSRNPSDRRRNPDAKPRSRLTGRETVRRGPHDTHTKIVTQSSRHPQPPSIRRLNQSKLRSSHHNRFSDQRNRSNG